LQEGVIISESRDSAAATLKRNGLQVLTVRPQSASGSKSFGRVKSRDLAIFTRQFSVMIDAGLPLVPVPRDPRGSAGGQELPERSSTAVRNDVEQGRHPPRPAYGQRTPRPSTTCM